MKKLIFILLAMVMIGISSCSKEGCTNTKATNYDSGADKDDGSCRYEAKVKFYIKSSSYSYLNSVGTTYISLYVDGTYCGYLYITQNLGSEPTCEATTNIVTKTLNWSGESSKSYGLKLVDEDGFEWYNSSYTFSGEDCKSLSI